MRRGSSCAFGHLFSSQAIRTACHKQISSPNGARSVPQGRLFLTYYEENCHHRNTKTQTSINHPFFYFMDMYSGAPGFLVSRDLINKRRTLGRTSSIRVLSIHINFHYLVCLERIPFVSLSECLQFVLAWLEFLLPHRYVSIDIFFSKRV